MPFELNNEKATDVLIWWVEGSDGSIDYDEEEEVKRILEEMSYSPETFYEETLLHISGLSTEHVKELVERSIAWAKEHFDETHKKLTVSLLENVALSNGKITDEQKEKIDRVAAEFGIG